MEIQIQTFNNRIRIKAIKMVAKYYMMDIKIKIIDKMQFIIMETNEKSIIDEDEVILEQIKSQYIVLRMNMKIK